MAQYKSRTGVPGALGVYLARALALAGLPNDASMGFYWQDFDGNASGTTPAGWSLNIGGTGSGSLAPAGRQGGIFRLATGATGGSVAGASTSGADIANVSTSRWYQAVRFALNTVPDANTTLEIGMLNAASNKTLGAGFYGALNPNNFVVQYDGVRAGSAIDLGVPKDTAFHIIEMYGTGSTTLRARIDGGAEFSAAMAAAPADSIVLFDLDALNGGTAANQSMDIDWILRAYPRS